jgi:hypothetical protein
VAFAGFELASVAAAASNRLLDHIGRRGAPPALRSPIWSRVTANGTRGGWMTHTQYRRFAAVIISGLLA